MHLSLISHIQRYIQLEEWEIDLICNCFTIMPLDDKDYLLHQGQVCRSYYFVGKGCLRMFFNNEKGIEQITHFALENWWMTDYFSFMDQKISDYNIQAIEESEIFSIDYRMYHKLLDDVPILERYFRMMSQRALAASQVRMRLMFDLSKEDMYLQFSSSFPQFAQRIPQYMLASYLGLTPEYLSKIRKKKQ